MTNYSTIIGRNWVQQQTCDYDYSDCESGISTYSSSSSISSGSVEDININEQRASFRIATYNVLTDHCIRPGQYLYCPPEIRYMPARHVTIMAEVKDMSPDIVCFQEVDHAHYVTRLQPSMKSLGFEGVLHQRLDDQGLATFWNINVFEIVDQKHSILHHAAETCLQMTSLDPDKMSAIRESICRPEAVLCVRLRHNNTDSHVAVANIHVTWSQLRYPALQTLQVSMSANELNEFVNGRCPLADKYGNIARCAQIILGDFNSPPDSLPYQLMSRGHISDVIDNTTNQQCCIAQLELDQLRADGLLRVLPQTTFTVKTPFKSAYKTILGKEPAVTNCDDACQDDLVKLCLDYIWFSPHSLDVAAVLETPPSDSITKHYALPSVDFPSDHIPL